MSSLTLSPTGASDVSANAHARSLTVENIPIYLADQGTGTPTLLLHGIFDSADVWRGVSEHLQKNYRVLAPDLPGFGRSGDPGKFDASLPHLAQFVDDLLGALGITEPINLVGYDVGATYGLAWAVTHPAKVRRLAIMNANFFSDYKWHSWAKVWRTPVLGEMIISAVNESTFAKGLMQAAPQLTAEQAREAARLVTPPAKRMALRHYRALDSANFRGWEDRLHELTSKVPTIVLWGDQDPYISPDYAERFGAQEVYHFSNNSHWLPAEAPAAVAERLGSFFSRDM